MPWELREQLEWALGTIVKPKFKVYDAHDGSFTISSATWKLIAVTLTAKARDTGSTALSGTCAVDNDDEDSAGNAIVSVSPTIDLNETDVSAGYYALEISVALGSGATDKFRARAYVRDYDQEP